MTQTKRPLTTLSIIRMARGLTQATLARILSLPTSTITSFEYGEMTPTTTELTLIAAALQCAPSDLLNPIRIILWASDPIEIHPPVFQKSPRKIARRLNQHDINTSTPPKKRAPYNPGAILAQHRKE